MPRAVLRLARFYRIGRFARQANIGYAVTNYAVSGTGFAHYRSLRIRIPIRELASGRATRGRADQKKPPATRKRRGQGLRLEEVFPNERVRSLNAFGFVVGDPRKKVAHSPPCVGIHIVMPRTRVEPIHAIGEQKILDVKQFNAIHSNSNKERKEKPAMLITWRAEQIELNSIISRLHQRGLLRARHSKQSRD